MGQTLEYLLKLQDQFSSPLKHARDEQGRFVAGTKKFGESAGAVNSLSGALVGLAAKIGAAFTAYKALEAGFAGFKHALSVASAMETTQTAFKTMLGSSAAMLQTLGEIKKLAMETPFEFPELANAGRMLLAFGEEAKSIPATLRRIGDVSAAIAAPIGEIAEIYGKARTQGTLFAEDINQLTGRGIPIIRELAKVLGQPESAIKKLAEESKITFPLLDQAFRNLTGAGGQFFNMMAEQAKTSAGMWSSLKDGVNELFLALGQPLNDAIKPVLTDAMGLAEQLKPTVVQLGTSMATALSAVRDFIAEANAGSGLAVTMGTALKNAFLQAADVAVVPFRAMGAALPALGEGLMAIFRPAGDWMMAKLESAALSFSSKIMVGIRDALKAMSESSFLASMMPGLGAAANSLTGPAAMAQNDALNASTRADNIGAAMPGLTSQIASSVGEAMGAIRGVLNEAFKPDPNALPASALDRPYNPMFPEGVLPPGVKPGKDALPPSALDPNAGPPKSILVGGAPKPAPPKALAPLPGAASTDAAGLAAAVAAATAQTPPAKARQAAGAAAAQTKPPVRAWRGGGVGGVSQSEADASDGDGGGKKPMVRHLMGGDGGALSARDGGRVPSRTMGGPSQGSLSGRKATPIVPSPGTARRSQERREAATEAAQGGGGGGSHPLMAVIKEMQAKLNMLAVAR